MRMLLDNSLLVSSVAIAGLWLAWIAKRERDIKNFKAVVAAEALLVVQLAESEPDSDISVERDLWLSQRVPRERWGWWKRRKRSRAHRRATGLRPQHYRAVMLSRRPDGNFNVLLIWATASSRLELITRTAELYGCEAPESFHDRPDEHAIWPIGNCGYLIVEPSLPRRRWKRPNSVAGPIAR